MNQTARYALPLLQSGQAQKEVTHNEAIAAIDTLLHLAVESRRTAGPPAAPADGTAWLIPVGASGAWSGRDGQIAVFDDAGTRFVVPRDGCIAFVRDESIFISRAGGNWQDSWPVAALTVAGHSVLGATRSSVAAPAGGSLVDIEGRAALAQLLAALRAMGLLAAT